MCDIVLINPGNRRQVFQELALQAAAIEPPFWLAAIAAFLRQQGYTVSIIDANAEACTPAETAAIAAALAPLLCAVVVYGSQPSASTQNMPAAGEICRALRQHNLPNILLAGLHPSALPERTLHEEACDFVAEGEAILTIAALLQQLQQGRHDYRAIGGLWWHGPRGPEHTERYPMVQDLDKFLPVAAWDLLPMHLYRAHDWHCFDDIEHRQPYAAIYTSLGCPFHCSFCCINAPFGKPGIRYRSPALVLQEIDYLHQHYGVRNLKIVDELFILNPSHYLPIVRGLLERNYGLNIWVYARVDTIDFAELPLLKQAGINWFALGIEAASAAVRADVDKSTQKTDVREVVRRIQDAGIRVIGNFIFGLPGDTLASMQETLALAMELNCEFANLYSVMAYPGSRLYAEAAAERPEALPASWSGYSQHSSDCMPLANDRLSAAEILQFRDQAFHQFYSNPHYLQMLEEKFGPAVRQHVQTQNSTFLHRNLMAKT